MNVNINYADMTLPLQGPENPFGDRNRFINQNALAGHVEEQSMTEHAFRQQHLTHAILGYSANPSVDPNAPAVLGSVEKAMANGFQTIGAIKAPKATKKDLKRKRPADDDGGSQCYYKHNTIDDTEDIVEPLKDGTLAVSHPALEYDIEDVDLTWNGVLLPVKCVEKEDAVANRKRRREQAKPKCSACH